MDRLLAIRRQMFGAKKIDFVDPEVERLCAINWGNGTSITYAQAAKVTNLGNVFTGNTTITSFDELQYFTRLTFISGGNYATNGAFNGCTALMSVTLPSNITDIRGNAFSGCNNLTNINLPISITSIGRYAFNGTQISGIVNLPNLISIGSGAFQGTKITKVLSLGSTITSIDGSPSQGHGIFKGCSELQEVVLPETITNVYCGFWDCTNLSLINIPISITTIEQYAFGNTPKLRIDNLYLPNLTAISNSAFGTSGNHPLITHITSLGRITQLPDGNGAAGYGVFFNFTGLLSVTLPNSLTKIGSCAFTGCSSLQQIEIPSNVTSIGRWSFRNCISLISITCLATTPPSIHSQSFLNCSSLTTIYVPSESVTAYKAAENWSTFASIIEAIPS